MPQQHLPTVKFQFISDPAHGWLIVSPQWIGAVGLNLAQFSHHSYVHPDGTLALEEDCDAPIFLDAYKRCFGETIAFQELHVENINAPGHIRSWYSLHAPGLAA